MKFRHTLLVLAVVGCGAPREVPQGPGPVPPPIVPPDGPPVATPTDVVDSGTFLSFGAGDTREEFTIKKRGANLVLTVRAERGSGEVGTEGEVVVDAAFRPVSGRYRQVLADDATTVTLGGSPLTLEEVHDDGRDPKKVTATKPVDIYIAGPGYVALTALCRIQGDVSLNTLVDREEVYEAYVGVPVGSLKRVVIDIADRDYEIVCDGDKLIAGAFMDFGLDFVRQGRERDLMALKTAARPAPHAWKRVQNESEPWESRFAWMLDKQLLVLEDSRSRQARLVSLDAGTGKKLAERIFKTAIGERAECEQLSRSRLVCGIAKSGELKILDGKTLTDVADLGPVLAKAVPTATGKRWSIDDVKGDVVSLIVGDQLVRIDIKKSAAVVETKEWKPTYSTNIKSPFACSHSGTTLKVGKDSWTLDVGRDTSTLKKNGKDVPPPGVRFGAFLACKPTGGAAYVISYGEHSVLGVIDNAGKLTWQVPINGHPLIIFADGNRLYVTTEVPERRIIAVDAKAKKIIWPAANP